VFSHALVLRAGRVLASGSKHDVLNSATLSKAFAARTKLVKTSGRYLLQVAAKRVWWFERRPGYLQLNSFLRRMTSARGGGTCFSHAASPTGSAGGLGWSRKEEGRIVALDVLNQVVLDEMRIKMPQARRNFKILHCGDAAITLQ